MKIEVGKTYVNKRGDHVLIISHEENHPLPFLGDNGCGYTADGFFTPEYNRTPSEQDLQRVANEDTEIDE